MLFSWPDNGAFIFPMEQMGEQYAMSLLSGKEKWAGVRGLSGVLLLRKIRITCQTQSLMQAFGLQETHLNSHLSTL